MGKNNAEESYIMLSPKVNSVRRNNKFYGVILLSIFVIICFLIVRHYLDMQLSKDDLSRSSSPVQETDGTPEDVIHSLNPAQRDRRPSSKIPQSQVVVLGKHHQRRSVRRSNLAANHPLHRPDVESPGQHKDGNLQMNDHDEELQHLLIFMVQMAGVFLVVSVGIYFACKMERDRSKLGKWSRSNPNVYHKAQCAACHKI